MTPPEKRSSLGVIFLTVFIDLVGFSIIFPLFPDMLSHYLGVDGLGPDGLGADGQPGQASLIGQLLDRLQSIAGGDTPEESRFRTQVLFGGVLGSLYSVLQFVFAPIWGRISDRVGRKPVLLVTITGLAVSYLAWIFAGAFSLLVASRFLGGVMSGNIAVASAAVADTTDSKSRTKGMAMIGIAFGLGFIFGPAIGSVLALYDPTESIEGIADLGVNPFSAPAAAAFVLSVLNLVWVQMRFQETLPREARGARRVERTNNPLKLFHKYEFPGVNRTNLAYFFYILSFAGMEFTLTFLAKDRFGYRAEEMWKIFVFIGVLLALTQGGFVRRVAPKWGERRLALTGLVAMPIGLILVGASESSETGLYGGLALLAFGSACVTPALAGLLSLYAPGERQGELQGVFRSLGALGRAVGPIGACWMYFEYGPWPLYVIGAGILLLPVALTSALPSPPERESA